MRDSTTTADVIIVGAGPTGLLLAGDLAAAGVRTIVLERRPAQDENLTRAFAVHTRTLELLDARGIADELVATGKKVQDFRLFGTVSIRFAGVQSRYPYLLVAPQYRTEQLLARRAAEHGVRVIRDARVETVSQHEQGVSVRTVDGTEYRGSYLVGADGVHSVVREQLGLPYPGVSVVRSVMLADVRLEREPSSTLTVSGAGGCFAFMVPFGDGWYRVITWDRERQLPDDAPVELSEVAYAMRQALGDDYGVHDPRWMSRFHSDERQVPRYRQGRVFLAGDAAHCHSPAGGLGMNTGLQDAANLGWKLAAVVRGAPERLLDSYHDERYPVGKAALRFSGALIRNALLGNPVLRRIRSSLLGGIIRLPMVRSFAIGTVSGLGIRYRAAPGSHRLVGKRAPDIALDSAGSRTGVDSGVGNGTNEPRRLYEALRSGRFVLVGAQVPEAWADRVLGVRPVEQRLPVMLVRPDGYIAWAGEDANFPEETIRQWLGSQSVSESAHRG